MIYNTDQSMLCAAHRQTLHTCLARYTTHTAAHTTALTRTRMQQPINATAPTQATPLVGCVFTPNPQQPIV
ncbi:MAG: hypothetical protein MI674_07525, partial [Cytophagales bacterium]|nr:hypothetical protein [Cytophagales bacterium]